MRWWWFGPSVTTAELEREMRRMREGGIGGFELAVVYPMALDDPARHIRNEPYLAGVPGEGRVHVAQGARARPAHGRHDRQRLVLRRGVHHARLGRCAVALGAPRDRARRD